MLLHSTVAFVFKRRPGSHQHFGWLHPNTNVDCVGGCDPPKPFHLGLFHSIPHTGSAPFILEGLLNRRSWHICHQTSTCSGLSPWYFFPFSVYPLTDKGAHEREFYSNDFSFYDEGTPGLQSSRGKDEFRKQYPLGRRWLRAMWNLLGTFWEETLDKYLQFLFLFLTENSLKQKDV